MKQTISLHCIVDIKLTLAYLEWKWQSNFVCWKFLITVSDLTVSYECIKYWRLSADLVFCFRFTLRYVTTQSRTDRAAQKLSIFSEWKNQNTYWDESIVAHAVSKGWSVVRRGKNTVTFGILLLDIYSLKSNIIA